MDENRSRSLWLEGQKRTKMGTTGDEVAARLEKAKLLVILIVGGSGGGV